jgi:tetratricopeptide (TPR) repeat protein
MDSIITAAARALAVGDPLGGLKRVALRNDASALALRGIAMAQLGDLNRARALLRQASRAFSSREAVSRARCIVAEAEVALASRDLLFPTKALESALKTLQKHGDRMNAAHARYLQVRRLLLLGQLDQAELALADLDPDDFPPALRASHDLVIAGIALRRLRIKDARAAISRAHCSARQAGIPALLAEAEAASIPLRVPAARLITNGKQQFLLLDDVEALYSSTALIIDACRYVIHSPTCVIHLSSRPVLFALAQALGEAWPTDVSRDVLLSRAFGAKLSDESHRARLRVEVGRLRRILRPLGRVTATVRGFCFEPYRAQQVAVLSYPIEEQHAALLALLSDGESWSSSALALVLGSSQRTVQRALDSLSGSGRIQSFGRGRSLRWMAPISPGFTTTLLLPPIVS